MRCIKVEKRDAEKIKRKLISLKVLVNGYKPISTKEALYFPVNKEIEGYKILNKTFEEVEKQNVGFGDYDQIGDIVIAGEDVSDKNAKEFLKIPNTKVVLRKVGIHHGEFRTQDLEFVAGEKRKETLYKENGVQMKLDVEKCYFSPRLSTERMRVASLVKDKEKVLVLFSGVGPYPLVIAKHSNPLLIVGVEKNKIAHEYAVYNCRKVAKIQLFNVDAKDFGSKEKFDRILMPLPKSAEDFLGVALKLVKRNGTIHFYDFLEERDIPEKALEKIRKKVKKFEVLRVVKCGKYAPGKYRICVDFKTCPKGDCKS
jgi:tRNA (guanine37-N1)-methyltransferase